MTIQQPLHIIYSLGLLILYHSKDVSHPYFIGREPRYMLLSHSPQ